MRKNNKITRNLITVICAMIVFCAGAARAANFTVNNNADTLDAVPGDGICADALGNCTLRAAIGEANALAGDDTINLPAGTYTITLASTGENANANGDFDILGNTTITGAGQTNTFVEADVTSGTALDRVFDIGSGAVVTIQNLTVRNGRITGLTDSIRGGGIRNLGTLTLNNMTVRDNQAVGGGVGSGGIRNEGPAISLTGVTVTNNLCSNSTASCFGGGMFDSASNGNTNISNSSFTNNTSTSTVSGSFGFAAGFGKEGGGALTIQDSTFSNNTGNGAGNGGSNGTGVRINGSSTITTTVNITNTVMSNNTGNTAAGNLHSGVGFTINGVSGGMPVNATLTNITVNQNSGSNNGGGIRIVGSANVTVNNSNITKNSLTLSGVVNNGGGIFVGGAILTLNNTNVTGNTARGSASGQGGGIFSGGVNFFDGGSTLTLNNSNVSNNNADSSGGIRILVGAAINITTTLNNTTISGNTGDSLGGGITNGGGQASATSTLNINNSTISENRTNGSGGGIYQSGSGTLTTNLNNSTIAGNTANSDNSAGFSENGGGINQENGTVNIKSSIVANNSVGGANANGPDCFGTLISGDYNLVKNTAGCTISGMTANNIIGVDPNLGPLANNGGPTLTHALLAGSPAIDKGNSFGLTTDQRGFTRPVDLPTYTNAMGGDAADIGAFEVQVSPTAASVVVGGQVTTTTGRGIANVIVSVTDISGNVLSTVTDSQGYYSFTELLTGDTYVFSVRAKRYEFVQSLQVLSINDSQNDVNFTAIPQGKFR